MMRFPILILVLVCGLDVAGARTAPNAAPAGYLNQVLARVRVDQHGDFVMIGNSMGWDCASMGSAPLVGTVGYCGAYTSDTSPDILWRSDDGAGTAMASTAVTPESARTTAMLDLPPGAAVTHAFLYWAGQSYYFKDTVVLLERPDGTGGTLFSENIVAGDTWSRSSDPSWVFQCVADVTELVRPHGSGAYRVTGLDALDPRNLDVDSFFAAWTLVVFYEQAGAPLRHLELWDGFYAPASDEPHTARMIDFLVPAGGNDAKLGVLAYEGDAYFIDDGLRCGNAPLDASDNLFDALNPVGNVFNSTRSYLGASMTLAGDLPRLAGTMDTMGGVDIDVFDVTSRMSPGWTSVDVQAVSIGDAVFVGAYVFSTTTHAPYLGSATKTVTDLDGGMVNPGDTLRYTVQVANDGTDNALDVEFMDLLDAGTDFVPGSLVILDGANAGPQTDVVGDDVAEYDFDTHTIGFRLGTGANWYLGGTLLVQESTSLAFDVVVREGVLGEINNQAEALYTGESGRPRTLVRTDGDPATGGDQPTSVEVVAASDVPDVVPARLVLHPCRPNPFNPQTAIAFELVESRVVTLRVFDVSGRVVRSLVEREMRSAGPHEVVWNGQDDSGRKVASGPYFCRLESGADRAVRRVMLVK